MDPIPGRTPEYDINETLRTELEVVKSLQKTKPKLLEEYQQDIDRGGSGLDINDEPFISDLVDLKRLGKIDNNNIQKAMTNWREDPRIAGILFDRLKKSDGALTLVLADNTASTVDKKNAAKKLLRYLDADEVFGLDKYLPGHDSEHATILFSDVKSRYSRDKLEEIINPFQTATQPATLPVDTEAVAPTDPDQEDVPESEPYPDFLFDREKIEELSVDELTQIADELTRIHLEYWISPVKVISLVKNGALTIRQLSECIGDYGWVAIDKFLELAPENSWEQPEFIENVINNQIPDLENLGISLHYLPFIARDLLNKLSINIRDYDLEVNLGDKLDLKTLLERGRNLDPSEALESQKPVEPSFTWYQRGRVRTNMKATYEQDLLQFNARVLSIMKESKKLEQLIDRTLKVYEETTSANTEQEEFDSENIKEEILRRRVQKLKQLRSFEFFTDERIVSLIGVMSELDLKSGDVLYRENDPCEALSLIEDGSDVYITGEVGLYEPNEKRLDTVIINSENAKVLLLQRNDFQEWLKKNPSATYNIIRSVNQLIKDIDDDDNIDQNTKERDIQSYKEIINNLERFYPENWVSLAPPEIKTNPENSREEALEILDELEAIAASRGVSEDQAWDILLQSASEISAESLTN